MKVKFIDRKTATSFVKDGAFKLNPLDFISISDAHSEADEMRKLWLENKADTNAALFLKFADVEDSSSGFTSKTAQQIIDFVNESMLKRKDIIVHCFAGVSRSAAVAKFINDYQHLDDPMLEDWQHHNLHVYYTLLETSGIPTLRQYYADLEKGNNG